MTDPSLPLSGLTVFEFCEVAAGPFCGMLLADMGAEVIKVERPGQGDTLRHWPPITNGYSENFASLNRNKKSIEVNVKDQPSRAALLSAIVEKADVIIENYRPGVMASNGLGYEAISALRPDLVYCSLSAFGQTGPRSRQGGFDVTIQAMSGIMSITGEPDGAPVKAGTPVSDFATGLYGAFSIVSSILRARASGKGCHIDISMMGASLAISALQTSEFFGTGRTPQKLGSAHPRNAPYRAFRASDDYFVVAAGNNKLWEGVCSVVGRMELLEDPRFATTLLRAQNQEALKAILEEEFGKRSARSWLQAFEEVGVPCSPINSIPEALADPQIAHLGLVQPMHLPDGTETRTFVSPVRLSGKNLAIRLRPPRLGEHTEDVLPKTR
ncbi:MAG TPA: carnitine dehydratase [Agrobacterium sp.]|uniref:CaiB/BaiF CoA transferase family protein n=1 Tax=Rhizobium sp. TaxID=391 RepID=UPI000EC22200|nr:carnitine dehydratase [Agrobacterium sp.]